MGNKFKKLTRKQKEKIIREHWAESLKEKVSRDPEWARQVAENTKAQKPVIKELNNAGFVIDEISHLRNARKNYKRAIPILLRWLSKIENSTIKLEIISALSNRQAQPKAARTLIEEFKRESNAEQTRWHIADALTYVADDGVYKEIEELARDKRYGSDREMLALALANMENPDAVDTLIDLLSDEEVAGHAVMALGKLKAVKAKRHLIPFLDHEKSWIRREAKRAIQKIIKHDNS